LEVRNAVRKVRKAVRKLRSVQAVRRADCEPRRSGGLPRGEKGRSPPLQCGREAPSRCLAARASGAAAIVAPTLISDCIDLRSFQQVQI
jgi:hypothetical protein